jgi:hypothetical protein
MEDSNLAQIKQARAKLWEFGELSWKMDTCQKKIHEFIKSRDEKIVTMSISRRAGKTYYLCLLAFETCLRSPRKNVKFVQPEQKMVRINLLPIFRDISDDCPKHLRPKFNRIDGAWDFPNGSRIQMAGSDGGNADRLRGSNGDLCIIDEAGFCSNLKYIINSVLIPSTLLTKGKIILSSTPPTNPGHEFVDYLNEAEKEGTLFRKTVYDVIEDLKFDTKPRITKEILGDIIKAYPRGVEDDQFKTEYLCEITHSSGDAVVPEFTPEVEQDIVKEWFRPAFYDAYLSMDIGFKDMTAVLFAYYDFMNGVVVIEDEFCMNGSRLTTELLAQEIKQKEGNIFYNKQTGEMKRPYMRVSDNNPFVINDLIRLHNLTFIPTHKDNKDAALSQLRTTIANRQIIINPKCKNLINELKNGIWEKGRKDYKRLLNGSHLDAVDALIYLIRNIDKARNPYPPGYSFRDISSQNLFHNNETAKNSSFSALASKISSKSSFGGRKKDMKDYDQRLLEIFNNKKK